MDVRKTYEGLCAQEGDVRARLRRNKAEREELRRRLRLVIDSIAALERATEMDVAERKAKAAAPAGEPNPPTEVTDVR